MCVAARAGRRYVVPPTGVTRRHDKENSTLVQLELTACSVMANALQLCRRGGSASRPAERGRLTADLKPLQQAGAETAVVPAAFRQVPRADQRNHFRAPGRVRADGNDVGTAGTRMLDSVASFGQENGANGPSSQAGRL